MEDQGFSASSEIEYWAPCPHGLEAVCADELRRMGIARVRPLGGGVTFFGPLEAGYCACLWSRTASRVLLVLARIDAGGSDALYAGVHDIPWEDHLLPEGSLRVDALGTNAALRNTQFVAVRVKDAICDRFRERCGVRPRVDTKDPDLRVNVSLHGGRATVAIDLSGDPLQQRGYRVLGRERGTVPSCRETIAAGMLLLAGWGRRPGGGTGQGPGAFLDPVAGDGTLLLEAAWIAGDIAPGILRSSWGFDRWLCHDEDLWGRLLDEADDRSERGREGMGPLVGIAQDPDSLHVASAAARRAGLAGAIQLFPASDADDAYGLLAHEPSGLAATVLAGSGNAAGAAQLPVLLASIATRLRDLGDGWDIAVLAGSGAPVEMMGMRDARVIPIRDGRDSLELNLLERGAGAAGRGRDGGGDAGKVPDSAREAQTPAQAPVPGAEPGPSPEGGHASPSPAGPVVSIRGREVRVLEAGTAQFAARLKKVYAQRRKWAHRNNISCYRVYDSDLPDYAVAIDVYEGAGRDAGKTFVQVAEYAAPSEIDPGKAGRRLADALSVTPLVLDVPASNVFSKTRRRERGGSQYARRKEGRSTSAIVSEDCLLFEVNFTDHLDTGIFLDHRLTRELIFERADRARFLNLFSYTGTATVHAAAGGAFQTTTVDLSQTYLDWARRNMAMNGFTGEAHEYVRADCVSWVQEMRHTPNRWDLVFVDVPTFSNSSSARVHDWDVQRDHVEFLIDVSRILTRTGTAIFSCNLRSFKPDTRALARAGVELEDITAQTIPEDFSRNPKIHHCYLLKRTP